MSTESVSLPPDNISNLTKHLTEEISGHTNLLVYQRTRNNLIFSIGPFVILGGIATNPAALAGIKSLGNLEFAIGIFIIIFSFLCLGYIGARIEEKLWVQCNTWRSEIAKLNGLESERIEFKSDGLCLVYILIFGIIGLVASSILYLIHIVK